MNKKYFSLFVVLFLMLLAVPVRAASTCSDERNIELTSLANNVNVDTLEYEKAMNDDGDQTVYQPAFYVRVFNLTKDLNLKVEQVGSKKISYFDSTNVASDGIIYLDSDLANHVKQYNITIRSNDVACKNQVLRKVQITTPQFNTFTLSSGCNGEDLKDFYLCQKFVDKDISKLTQEDFNIEVNKYREENKKNKNNIGKKTSSFFIKNGKVIIIIAAIVAGVVVILVLINKKRKKLI